MKSGALEKAYKKLLSNNAKINFQCFQQEEIQKSKEEIFANAFKINFFSTLYDYLTEEHDLDIKLCEFLCKSENIIDSLYSEYLDKEFASINTYDDIYDLIRNYSESYNSNSKDMEM